MNEDLHRREFFASAATSLLGFTGWMKGLLKGNSAQEVPKSEHPPLDARFTYDVSQFTHTDPSLILYREGPAYNTGLNYPRCIAVGPKDEIYVGGDRLVQSLDCAGNIGVSIRLEAKPYALAASADRLFVALKDHLEVFDLNGKPLDRHPALGGKTFLTGVADAGDCLYLADAGQREIVRCSPEGKVLGRFGRRGNGNPGFVIPSPYFSVRLGGDGLLWVNNPGRHQMEAYTTEGQFELGWGETGMSIESFCGCCNPVHFTRLPDGSFITSEKGLNRIKVYDARGKFKGVVAGPGQLVKDPIQAQKAYADCSVGFGVVSDSTGRVLALDPTNKTVRTFTLKTA